MTATATALIERSVPEVVIGGDLDEAGAVATVTRAGDVVLALGLGSGEGPNARTPAALPGTAATLARYGLEVDRLVAQERVSGSAGTVVLVAVAGERGAPSTLALVGVGDGNRDDLRRAGAALARALSGVGTVRVGMAVGLAPTELEALTEGMLLGAYSAARTGHRPRTAPVARIEMVGAGSGPQVEGALDRARSTARAAWLARDLAVTPSSVKNPQWVADSATALAEGVAGVSVRVLDADQLERQGFGGLVAVGGGSATPPALVQVRWRPPRSAGPTRHVVVVGKGITYDTGGLSIKPRESMVAMKTDMSGAGVVLAATLAAARESLPVRVTAVLPLAENAVGAASYRPDDVVTIWGGTTVEIANTDAEGRIVLADALAWSVATLAPDVVVDIATLTGAATLGLGRGHAALYSDDDRLVAAIGDAAQVCGEQVWRMPLVEDYLPELESSIADLRHVTPDRTRFEGGGSIAAALFLREFVGNVSWAHLDVAGPSRSDRDRFEVPKGATGFGARLLLHWLRASAR